MISRVIKNRGDWKIPPVFLFQLFVFIGAFLVVLALPTEGKRATRAPRPVVRSEYLSHFTLGFRFLVADSMWIRLIQEIDYRESDNVNKGWVYQMLDGITTLDTRYRIVYSAGVSVLSVLIQDKEGARILYDRAVDNYPTDWMLLYKAAYHYLYEIKDCGKAAALLKRAVDNGAPPWVSSLSGKLYQKAGRKEMARSIYTEALKRFAGTYLEPRLRDRLADLDRPEQSRSVASLDGIDCLDKPQRAPKVK